MKRVFKIIGSLVIALIFLALLLSQISITQIIVTIKNFPIALIVLGSIAYVLATVFRTLRFRYLMTDKVLSVRTLLPIAFTHLFLINLLPFRSGEFSFMYFLKKHDISVTNSTAILVVARVHDLITVVMVGIVAIVVSGFFLKSIFLWLAIGIILSAIITFLWFSLSEKRPASWLRKKTTKLLGSWLGGKVAESIDHFQFIHNKKSWVKITGYTILIWSSAILVYVILLTELIPQLLLSHMVLGGSLNILLNTIPIQGLAGFGTIEGIWTLVFWSFGIEKDTAIASGFTFHIMKIIYLAIVGTVGIITMKIK